MKKNFFYVSAITLSLVLSSCGAKSEEKETTETPAVETPATEPAMEETTTEEAPVDAAPVQEEAKTEHKANHKAKPEEIPTGTVTKPVINKVNGATRNNAAPVEKPKEEQIKEAVEKVEKVEGAVRKK